MENSQEVSIAIIRKKKLNKGSIGSFKSFGY